ncbi:hypothetical protein JTE90_019247 [Oedothorax gibbosus]|uniref:Uncharacterized protein n=1 Tax=Oedothorax gibbosus TaxID=931172 RepID=A0AAV6UTB9_9ARAC|nr:hypothetical protein JTE90_019247 [Oedothorax gibbosus]
MQGEMKAPHRHLAVAGNSRLTEGATAFPEKTDGGGRSRKLPSASSLTCATDTAIGLEREERWSRVNFQRFNFPLITTPAT